MRVVTRAASMASMVSASPGPVPGAAGNCAWQESGRSAANRTVVVRRMRVKKPPNIMLFMPIGCVRKGKLCNLGEPQGLEPALFSRLRHDWSRTLPAAGDNIACRWHEGPLSHFAGANQKRQATQRDFEQPPLARGSRLPKQPRPADHGEHRW